MDSSRQVRGHHMKRLARKQFAQWADSYDRSLLRHFLFEPTHHAIMELIYRRPKPENGGLSLLDVGSGTGTLAARLVTPDLAIDRVVGLDFALPMCQQAEAKARQTAQAHRPHFVNGDSEHLPFPDDSFDLLTCANSFHHYPHQANVVAEFRRVLRPGGQLLLADGFRDNVIGWFVFDVCIASVERVVYHAKWSEVRAMFAEVGFTDVVQRKINFWFPVLLTVGTA